MAQKRIVVAGGGLAGLITALHLAREGIFCTVVEKKKYPFHRVCGEYISQEVVPYLKRLDIYPDSLRPVRINRFQLSSVRGEVAEIVLNPGGFGVSRYALDHYWYECALQAGVHFLLDTEINEIREQNKVFSVDTSSGVIEADIVIAAHGKRSRIDKYLKRDFFNRSSPYVGVKYHARLDAHPEDLISLHNFTGGYCGVSRVEGGQINICYLTHRDNVRTHGNLRHMEEAVLFRNPLIRELFRNAQFLFENPETINEISFETKGPVENHIFFCGDAAGMITPLCGNGMAMAIHSAKLLAERVARFCNDDRFTREMLERDYAKAWRSQFGTRLWSGRVIQNLFGGDTSSNLAVAMARHVKPVARFLVGLTHGKPF